MERLSSGQKSFDGFGSAFACILTDLGVCRVRVSRLTSSVRFDSVGLTFPKVAFSYLLEGALDQEVDLQYVLSVWCQSVGMLNLGERY